MTRLASTAFIAALALGGVLAGPGTASAAMPSAAPIAGAASDAASGASLLEDVRYVNRCGPVTSYRRDRFGRPVAVTRNVCRQVWVPGPRRYYRGY